MSQLVTIFGGSGFVGRYIARRMAKEGWLVRVATRRPNEALFVTPYGEVGPVAPVLCNIRDGAAVAAAAVLAPVQHPHQWLVVTILMMISRSRLAFQNRAFFALNQ